MPNLPRLLVLLGTLALTAAAAAAHELNQSYIYLRVDAELITGRVELNLEDVNRALGTTFRLDLRGGHREVLPE
ncbi:MAG: hypothetical protein AAFP22_19270, partial [Planctomycetota bacterium]